MPAFSFLANHAILNVQAIRRISVSSGRQRHRKTIINAHAFNSCKLRRTFDQTFCRIGQFRVGLRKCCVLQTGACFYFLAINALVDIRSLRWAFIHFVRQRKRNYTKHAKTTPAFKMRRSFFCPPGKKDTAIMVARFWPTETTPPQWWHAFGPPKTP